MSTWEASAWPDAMRIAAVNVVTSQNPSRKNKKCQDVELHSTAPQLPALLQAVVWHGGSNNKQLLKGHLANLHHVMMYSCSTVCAAQQTMPLCIVTLCVRTYYVLVMAHPAEMPVTSQPQHCYVTKCTTRCSNFPSIANDCFLLLSAQHVSGHAILTSSSRQGCRR